MKPFLLHQPAGRSDSGPGPLLAGELHGHEAYWRQIGDDVVQVSPLYAGARFFWCRTTSRPTRCAARPRAAGGDRSDGHPRRAGHHPCAGLTMRSQELVREYGLTRSSGATGSGTWQIISTVNARITARDWFVTRSGSRST
jgi:glycine betaine/proline transport system substrate-binding protein